MTALWDVLAYRPCGACGAYVSVEDKCEHWRGAKPRTAYQLNPILTRSRAPLTDAERTARYKARKKGTLPPAERTGPLPLPPEDVAARKRERGERQREADRERRARAQLARIQAGLPLLGPGGRPRAT